MLNTAIVEPLKTLLHQEMPTTFCPERFENSLLFIQSSKGQLRYTELRLVGFFFLYLSDVQLMAKYLSIKECAIISFLTKLYTRDDHGSFPFFFLISFL